MNDGFCQLGIENSVVGDVLLVGLYLTEGRYVVDDAVNPDCFDVGDVAALDLVGDVVVVPLEDLLLSEDLSLKFFLIAVGQSPDFLGVLVKKHLPIKNLLLL